MKLWRTIIKLRLGTKSQRYDAVQMSNFSDIKNPLIKALITKALIKVWKDDNAPNGVRRDAVRGLGILGDIRAWETLINALERGYNGACWGLAKIGNARAVEPLIKALGRKDRDWSGSDYYRFFRRDAAEALGLLGDTRAVEPLIVALGDEDRDVRSSAMNALGKLADIRAVEPLTMELGNENPDVRRIASESLEKLGHMQWSQCIKGDFDDFKRLGLSGYPNAVKSLIKALRDDRSYYRSDAAKALGALGDDRAVEPLISKLDDCEASVRESAARALEKLGDRRALDPLLAALKFSASKESNYDAGSISEAIGMLGGVAELASLMEKAPADEIVSLAQENKAEAKALKEAEKMACHAVRGLEKCQQIDPLTKALKSRNTRVRNYALCALRDIGDIRDVDAFLNELKDVNLPFKSVQALRNFGDDCSIRLLVSLVLNSEQGSRGELTKTDLEIILRRHACKLSIDDLQILMDARDYVYQVTLVSYDSYDESERREEKDVKADLSRVRKLARKELSRRGLLA